MATEPVVLTEDPRGRALRFHGLDLHSPGPSWDVPSGIQMVHEAGDDGVGCHRLVLPYVPEKWGSWAIASDHTIPVAPNRNYLLFALIDCDFERPAEINLGLRQIDGGGKYVMYRMNGILNNTCGWSRWEWEVTTDPQAAHVMFGIDFYPMAVGGPEVFSQGGRFRIADVALIELPPKELTPYARGKGATFRGGPGNLPMRVLDAR